MAASRTQKARKFSTTFYKELFLAVLAVASVISVIYEFVAQPEEQIIIVLGAFDLAVAFVFLADFCSMWYKAPDRRRYVRHNWYLLLASLPILDSWAELLRGLRLLELVRLIRAGEHLSYVYTANKNSSANIKPSRRRRQHH